MINQTKILNILTRYEFFIEQNIKNSYQYIKILFNSSALLIYPQWGHLYFIFLKHA